MREWEKGRDIKLSDYISRMEEESYDFIAKDIWFRNGEKADLVKYHPGKHEFKVIDFFEPESEIDSLIASLRSIGDLLYEEGFKFESSTKRTDIIREDYKDVEGDYFIEGSREQEILDEIGYLFRPENFQDRYEEIEPVENLQSRENLKNQS